MDYAFGESRFPGFDHEGFMRKQKEKADLKKVGFYTGMAIIGNIVLQNLLVVVLSLAGLTDKYLNDGVFSAGFDILFTVIALLVPFMIAGRKMQKYSSVQRVFLSWRTLQKFADASGCYRRHRLLYGSEYCNGIYFCYL